MNITRFIRASHPWFGITLVALTIINFVAFGLGYAIPLLYYLPLVPLFLSMLSGLWMFLVPYFSKRQA